MEMCLETVTNCSNFTDLLIDSQDVLKKKNSSLQSFWPLLYVLILFLKSTFVRIHITHVTLLSSCVPCESHS